MEEKLISVIVPVYKVEKYLKKCVDSIINQTYKNLEIILVDDGSPDKCPEICDEYAKKDSRIKVIHKQNGGLSDARNAGIDIAKGDYIAFVDSDDFIDKKMYEILYKNLTQTDSDLSICSIRKFSDEDVFDCEIKYESEKVRTFSKIEMFSHMMDKNNRSNYVTAVVAWNKLYKRRIFDSLRYPVGKLNEDIAVFHYIINETDKIVLTNLELYNYYQRNDSIMNVLKFNLLDECEFLYERLQFFDAHPDIVTRLDYNRTKETYFYKYISLFREFLKKGKIGYIFKSRKYLKIYRKLLKNYEAETKQDKLMYKLFSMFPLTYVVLRKIKSKISNYFNERKIKSRFFKLKKNFVKNFKKAQKNCDKKYIIFNAPNHGNLGDHAIIFAEKKFFQDNGIEPVTVISDLTDYFIKNYKQKVSKDDVIFITGGGNLGTIWEHEQINVNKVLENFSQNKIVIFPQTIRYSENANGQRSLERDNEVYGKCKDITLFCRDFQSYKWCSDNINVKNVFFSSDIVTYLNFSNLSIERKGIAFCFRSDKEKSLDGEVVKLIKEKISEKYPDEPVINFDTKVNDLNNYTFEQGEREVLEMLKTISSYKLVVTDRLHGMVFSTICGTPCIAFSNTTGKVKGVFDWLSKENDYVFFAENIEDFESIIEKIDISRGHAYSNENMKKSFDKILEVIDK